LSRVIFSSRAPVAITRDDQPQISDTITEIFSDMLHIALNEREPSRDVACDVSGCVHVSGPHEFVLTVEANTAFVQRAAMALLETDTRLEDAAIPEAFAELVNIVAGNLTGVFESAHFTRPVVANGAAIVVPNASRTLRGAFEDDAGGVIAYSVYPAISTWDE
jgi:hypothetical protein